MNDPDPQQCNCLVCTLSVHANLCGGKKYPPSLYDISKISMGVVWDLKWIPMGSLCYFHGIPMGALQHSYGISMIEGSLEVKLPTTWTDGKAEV